MAAADHPGTPSPQTPSPQTPAAGSVADPAPGADHPHNFEVQKEIHQQIRNDPDYDDWEYGTEPLPHEAWVEKAGAASGERPAGA